MATPAPSTPDSPPTLPTTNDPESTFDTLWDAFNNWLTTVFWPYLVSVVASTFANATEAQAAANTATAQALAAVEAKNDAEAAVVAATAVSGATEWAAGSYAAGAVVWSPTNGANYRRKAPGGASPADPATDPANWYSLVNLQGLTLVRITANTVAVAGRHYVIAAPCELLLPPSPNANDRIGFTDITLSRSATVNPNGGKIRNVSGVMTLNAKYAEAVLIASGSTEGWI